MNLYRVPQRMEDLALFTRQVAGAMRARAPLPVILRAHARDAEDCPLTRAVAAVADRIEAGVPFSEALEDHPAVFPSSFRRLVRLGEQGRTLPGVMEQLADSLEQGLKTYEIFRRAAIYPLVVLVLLLLDLWFLALMIVPKFVDIYSSLGMPSPFMLSAQLGPLHATQWLLAGLGLLTLIPVLFLVGALLGLRFRGVGQGRMWLNLPFVGVVLRRVEVARLSGRLALLLRNRIPLTEALGLLAESSENAYVRDAVADLGRRFESGERLGDLIASQPLFPAGMAAIVAASEDHGELAEALGNLSRFYTDRAAHDFEILREAFEPAMLVMVGLMVSFVLLAVYGPMFQLPKLV